MGVVYRDEHGVEYESVPLPTHEVTHAVPLEARLVSHRTSRKPMPFYTGTDGAELAQQPRPHRKQWTDDQWIAFKEHEQLETELSRDDEPVAAAMIIKTT